VGTPALHVRPAQGDVTSVVLVLHGGKVASDAAVSKANLVVLRMVPYARSLERALAPTGVEVWSLRFGVRGWNGPLASPVADVRSVLENVRRRHGDVPVVIVGHSRGGRTALRAADDPSVIGVVALAPWLPADEPVASVAGKAVLILHGKRDRWVPAAGSRAWASRAQGRAVALERFELAGTGHPMLRRARTWHALVTTHVAGMLARARTDQGPGPNVGVTAAQI
jgi:pimeloyl-ACP methyl ester carboxylesterase